MPPLVITALAVVPLVRLIGVLRAQRAPSVDVNGGPFFEWLWRSAAVPSVLAAIVTLAALFAGYALSRAYIRRGFVAGTGTVLMAGTVLLLPPYAVGLEVLGQARPALALLLIYGLIALPFCTWLVKRAADAVRPSLLEAARVDGCSSVQCIRLVVLPFLWRAIIASAIFAFVLAWDLNLFFTLPIAANRTAVGLLLSLPFVILFVVIGRSVSAENAAGRA